MMASARGRSRRHSEIDDEELAHSPSTVRSSASPEARPEKRLRRGNSGNITPNTSVEDDEVDEGIEFGDAGDEEEEEEDDDEEAIAATQREFEQRKRDRETGAPNESEVIKSIELFNFMCHKRLEIKFGDKINFIIGHNGSGKSAILTALTICLGGKATATNRGSSLKSLIKEGESSATVTVKILNGGKDPYKPELYGDVISIERRFSKDGSSGYKIRSKTGHVVSTKREELQEILDHIQLQVDNPMTILTQDTARQFLGNSSVGDKYKLFMRGVQLSQLDTDYTMVEEQISTLEATLSSKKDALNTLKANEEEWRTKVKIFERSAAIEDQVKDLQNQYAWSQVKEQEKIVANNEAEINKVQERIDAINLMRDEAKVKLEEQDLQVQTAKDANKALVEREPNLRDQFNAAKEAVTANKATLDGLANDQKDIEGLIKNCEDSIKDHTRKIIEEEGRRDDGGERQRLQTKLAELEANINTWTTQCVENDNSVAEFTARIKSKEEEGKVLRKERDEARLALSDQKNRLNNLERTKVSALSVYHPNMSAVLDEIERQKNRFQDKPIGPLGASVKIKREEWASICEVLFGKLLNGFLVSSHRDQITLREILKKKQCEVPIVVSKRDLFDYRDGEPDSRFTTVLRVLDISDEYVKRQLIDQNHIESTILIANRKEADEVMHSRPRNVTSCFALNPEKKGFGYRIAGIAGGSGIAPVYPWKNPPRLTTRSVDEQIKEVNAEISRFQKIVVDRDHDIAQLERTIRGLRAELRAAQATAKEASTSKDRAVAEAENLRETLAEQQPDSGRIIAFQTAIDEAKDQKKSLLAQIASLRKEQDEAIAARPPLVQAASSLKKELQDLAKQIKVTADELAQATSERMQTTSNIRHYEKQISDRDAEHKEATEKTEKERAKLDEIFAGASSYCPVRISNEDLKWSVKRIEAKIEALKGQMARMQQDAGMTEEDARAKYIDAHEQYQNAGREMKSLENLRQVLWNAFVLRRDRYYRFRTEISSRAQKLFVFLLSQRGYSGKLIFDHRKEEIRVRVHPPGDTEHGSRKDPKSLSGGEKSFAQLCLLLSVWEAMGSPIRALDEFDVFMDAVNRKTSMALMIEAARHSLGRQFILITPQDMGNVALGPDIRVHRMRDPERGQAVIESM